MHLGGSCGVSKWVQHAWAVDCDDGTNSSVDAGRLGAFCGYQSRGASLPARASCMTSPVAQVENVHVEVRGRDVTGSRSVDDRCGLFIMLGTTVDHEHTSRAKPAVQGARRTRGEVREVLLQAPVSPAVTPQSPFWRCRGSGNSPLVCERPHTSSRRRAAGSSTSPIFLHDRLTYLQHQLYIPVTQPWPLRSPSSPAIGSATGPSTPWTL